MPRSPPQSYLLCLWREHAGTPLCATLIAVAQPEAPQHHFDTLEDCFAHLHAPTAAPNALLDDFGGGAMGS